MSKKQRKPKREDPLNPRILTFAQALALAHKKAATREIKSHNNGLALAALGNRLRCRFTGPSDIHQLTKGERLVRDLSFMHSEVLNGGFHQYLSNCTGDSCEDVKLHLQKIRAPKTLHLFRRLSKIFPRSVIPRDQAKRLSRLEKWERAHSQSKLIDELSKSFYLQTEDLDALILQFVRKHKAEFAEPSDSIVRKMRLKNRITRHYCGTAESIPVEKAEKSLAALQQFAESNPVPDWRAEFTPTIKSLALNGEKKEATRVYKDLYMCSLAEAKAAIAQMIS